jgi:hypothetical protein
MSVCPICEHAKIQAINDALDSGRYVGVIARQYRLDVLELDKHREHRRPIHGERGVYTFGEDLPRQVLTESTFDGQIMVPVRAVPETAMEALQRALPHLRRAARLIKSDDEYEAIVMKINDILCAGGQFVQEQLQQDDMGVP